MNIISVISQEMLTDSSEIKLFVNTAPYRYKVYDIPKRNGNGSRRIAQPSSVLKFMQKVVLEKCLQDLPIHPAATAYMAGIGIRENAARHKRNRYLLKMDFSNFFPSILADDFIMHLELHKGVLSQRDAEAVRKIFFWVERRDPLRVHKLSIGAPSSPFISNTIMYEFDSKITMVCEGYGVTYTRYADDLTFTTNERGILFEFPDLVDKICKEIAYPALSINSKKTVFSSKKNNRHVTGLVLTNDGDVSLGRERKRYIKSLVYQYSMGALNEDQVQKLKGLISFSRHVEFSFYISLVKKYGDAVVSSIVTGKPNQ